MKTHTLEVGSWSTDPRSVFINTCAKSKNHPKMTERRKLNGSLNLLKSMEEYRQEYGKGMTVSHTLEDS